jgi:hypothetical protein
MQVLGRQARVVRGAPLAPWVRGVRGVWEKSAAQVKFGWAARSERSGARGRAKRFAVTLVMQVLGRQARVVRGAPLAPLVRGYIVLVRNSFRFRFVAIRSQFTLLYQSVSIDELLR